MGFVVFGKAWVKLLISALAEVPPFSRNTTSSKAMSPSINSRALSPFISRVSRVEPACIPPLDPRFPQSSRNTELLFSLSLKLPQHVSATVKLFRVQPPVFSYQV